MNLIKKIAIIVISIIILILAGIGVKNHVQKQKMLEVVKSEEAKKVYKRTLKNADSKALTDEGIIKSYKIDYDSVEHNPMGGIMLDLIINDDKSLIVDIILNKNTSSGNLVDDAGGTSPKLEEMLTERGGYNE